MLLMIDNQHARPAAFVEVLNRVTMLNDFNDFISTTMPRYSLTVAKKAGTKAGTESAIPPFYAADRHQNPPVESR